MQHLLRKGRFIPTNIANCKCLFQPALRKHYSSSEIEDNADKLPGFLAKLQKQHEYIIDPKVFQNPLFIFPTRIPLFPYNSLVTRINPVLQQALEENNIEHVGAFVLKDDDPSKIHWLNQPKDQQGKEPQIIIKGGSLLGANNNNGKVGRTFGGKGSSSQTQFKMKQYINQDQLKKQLEQLEENSYQNLIYDDNLLENSNFQDYKSKGILGVTSLDALYKMGTLCKIKYHTINDQGQDLTFAILRGIQKIQIIGESKIGFEFASVTDKADEKDVKQSQFSVHFARCQPLRDSQEKFIDNQYKLKLSELLGIYAKLRQKIPINVPELQFNLADPRTIDILSGFLSLTSFFKREELMKLFETIILHQRLVVCLELMKRYEAALSQQWEKIEKQSTLPMDIKTSQKQMENIYHFLKKNFTSPNAQLIIEKLNKSLKGRVLPDQVRKIIEDELNGLSELSESHPDFNVKRSFLELISSLPFGIATPDNFDLENARKILDNDHFGIQEVKQRILEFIAVAKLKGKVQGKTLLLVGPPGVGKTSIASSIAKCLGRKFARISLGGEYDVAVIKGHRKTYMGSYPGKIVQALKIAGAENPVILLDEIDKTARSYRGNIQDALLEVLDPVQNSKFVDNYMEIPIDLSKVLFICSANLLETVHPALLDRTEIIELSGYTTEEKQEIFNRHLLPKILKQSGLNNQSMQVTFNKEGIEKLIKDYAREAGVRSLERFLKRICEKVALKIITKSIKEPSYIINPHQLKQLIGLPIFTERRMYEGVPPPGIIVGLAYNSYGGSIIYIETNKYNFSEERTDTSTGTTKKEDSVTISELPTVDSTTANKSIQSKTNSSNRSSPAIRRKGLLKLTGQVGEVMQESIQIAYTYAKYVCYNFFDNSFLEENDVHIHFPSGASKKDGPSAGISITTSLISLALNRQTEKEIAMTGEISLTGKVLKIGGVKEKILASKREGINSLIFPLANQPDVNLLKDYIKKDLEINYAENYFDVLNVVFKSYMMSNSSQKVLTTNNSNSTTTTA